MIGDCCPLAMKRNITKHLLRVHGSVRDSDSMRAGTARGENSETRVFDAYQFRVFENVVCFMSLRRSYYLDKAVTLLFRNSTMLGQKEM